MILIFTTQYDSSSNIVIQWLDSLGQDVIRINGDEHKYSLEKIDATGIYFKNAESQAIINLSSATACWWRRTGIREWHLQNNISNRKSTTHTDGKGIDLQTLLYHYMRNELKSLQTYIHNRLYSEIPINLGSPTFDLNRLHVLEEAKKLNISVPHFEIVTNLLQLKATKNKYKKLVTKAIGEGLYDVIGNTRYYTYTEEITDFMINNIGLSFPPSLVMEEIDKQFEVRSFYIDGAFFSMAILSQSNEDSKVDFRKAPPAAEFPYKLPIELESKLRKLYKHLNLNTGSADIIVDKNNQHIFLEINPVGQFGMTSIPCNYNLEEKIAKYLIYGKNI